MEYGVLNKGVSSMHRTQFNCQLANGVVINSSVDNR